MSNSLVICIGSNSNDREWQMKNGIKWLQALLYDCKVSSIYKAAAINGIDNEYLNAVIKAKTKESLNEITVLLKQYETIWGRTPASKQDGIIPIDLDIIMWNDEIIREKDFGHSYFREGWREIESE